MKMKAFGITDVGLKRTNNEDAFAIRPDLGFCVVADGMGGAAAGEVASRIFVETAQEVLSDNGPSGAVEDLVKRAFTLANARMLEHVSNHPAHAGMGCTAEILAVTGADIVIGHVGDSRTYRFRSGELRQLTADHSLVQDQLSKGLITPEEARKHPMRNVILRAVGAKETIELDVLRGRGLKGDIFLLCSDGLTDMIGDDEILKCVNATSGIQEKASVLVELAKVAGGKDNITVVLAEME
jgi:protein phosphatase